jgi:ubiquinone/menaquinone biosynthesis C-methylase UbiE
MNTGSAQDRLLAEQRAYYSALAPDYLDKSPDLAAGAELTDALDAFRPAGSVLEFACGPGTWTSQLLRYASDVTAVDASAEMLAIAPRPGRDGLPAREGTA